MLCACGKTALYRANKQSFCKDHYAEAVKATAVSDKITRSWAGVRSFTAQTSNPKDMSRGGSTRRSEYKLELNGKRESSRDQAMKYGMGKMHDNIPYDANRRRRGFTK